MDIQERHSLGILANEGVPVLASRKRCRQGSLADDISQNMWPAGPACLDELFSYPEQHLETIAQKPELMSRLSHLVQHGVVHSSDCARMLAEREGLRLVLQAVQERTGSHIPYRFARACDLDQECQRFLWHSAQVQDNGQSCLFADIRCQIHVHAQDWCASCVPDAGSSPGDKVKSYRMMDDFLRANGSWAVDQDCCSPHMFTS